MVLFIAIIVIINLLKKGWYHSENPVHQIDLRSPVMALAPSTFTAT
jgi:hypothetical protein